MEELKKKADEILSWKTVEDMGKYKDAVVETVGPVAKTVKDKVQDVWSAREEHIKRMNAFKDELTSKSFDQRMDELRQKLVTKVDTWKAYASSAPIQQQIIDAGDFISKYSAQKLDEFETYTGTKLPEPDPKIIALQKSLHQKRSEYGQQLFEAKSVLEQRQARLVAMTKAYEKKGAVAVREHEDMLQFKYMCMEMEKEVKDQSQAIEEVMSEEMKQYVFQAKDVASTSALVGAMGYKIRTGQPFKSDLGGILSFEKLSTLVDPSAEPALEVDMIHKAVRDQSETGAPTLDELHNDFAVFFAKAAGLRWQLPNSGMIGRVLSQVSSNMMTDLADDQEALLDLKMYMDEGRLFKAYHQIEKWYHAHPSDPTNAQEGAEVKQLLQQFGNKLTRHIYCSEFMRYMAVKMASQQRSMLE